MIFDSAFGSYSTSNLHCGVDIRGTDVRGVAIPITCTVPGPLHVGDNFTINAVLFNYSPDIIKIRGAE
jgi:hypothetical protein